MTARTGRCLCGNVTYRLTADPIATVVCWCRDCQHFSSNGSVNAIVPNEAVEVVGNPSEYESLAASGSQLRYRFCSRCGCHLFGNSTAAPLLTAVRVGTLDEPSSVTPAVNIWSASAPAWACLDAGLKRVQRQ